MCFLKCFFWQDGYFNILIIDNVSVNLYYSDYKVENRSTYSLALNQIWDRSSDSKVCYSSLTKFPYFFCLEPTNLGCLASSSTLDLYFFNSVRRMIRTGWPPEQASSENKLIALIPNGCLLKHHRKDLKDSS